MTRTTMMTRATRATRATRTTRNATLLDFNRLQVQSNTTGKVMDCHDQGKGINSGISNASKACIMN